jgi:hypothetical protein
VKITEFVNKLVVPRKCLLEVSFATMHIVFFQTSKDRPDYYFWATPQSAHTLLACGWDHRESSHLLSNCGVVMNFVVSSVRFAKAKITEFVNELVVPRNCLVEVSFATMYIVFVQTSKDRPDLYFWATPQSAHTLLACGWDHRESSRRLCNCEV